MPGEVKSARVAVVTRTRDRNDFLQRAGASVAAQTFTDLVWVVVNDGGDPEAVGAAIDGLGADRPRAVLRVDHEAPLGRGAAANAGARAADSAFIHLHDDDDTVAPDFLERMVARLDATPFAVGACAPVTRIVERVEPDGSIRERRRKASDLWPGPIPIVDMAERNWVSPIGLVYRREGFQAAGGYPEDMPVMEDWVFHLHLMLAGEIWVDPASQAFHHLRPDPRGGDGAARNSMEAELASHQAYDIIVRNRFLRREIGPDGRGLAALMNPPDRVMRGRLKRLLSWAAALGRLAPGGSG